MRLSDQMESGVELLAQVAEEAALNEVDFKVGFAKALLAAAMNATGKITVGDKEAQATVECEYLMRARLISNARHEVSVERLRTLRSRIDSLRTVSANLRSMGG